MALWTKKEEEYLENNYNKCTDKEIAIELNRSSTSVKDKRRSLNLFKNKNKKRVYRNCRECNSIFVPTSSKDQEYCSKDCFDKSRRNRIEKECLICGKTYRIKPSKKNISRYCSRDCQWIAIGKQKRQEKDNCDRCGKPKPHKNKKYCSQDCYVKDLRKRESILTKEEYQKVRNKFLAKKNRLNLTAHYVKKTLPLSGIKTKDLPQGIIELKRLNIKRKRIIRNHNQK